jgi:threonylcarbamoyladenosine tRNA methylthiotransferase MtaB
MGCYATRAPQEVGRLPGVYEVVTDKRELPDLLARFGVIDVPRGISSFGSRQRAYVKVQDGCLLNCAFCIIPTVRPSMASRPPADILSEVGTLVRNGYREIVLTGVHLGHYGVEWNRGRPKRQWLRLSHLLRQIVALGEGFRLRLSSIEATEVTRELIDALAEFPDRICPHLHVCLQSGSDRVLRRMRRRWGAQRFVDRCGLIKEKLVEPALTTDVIVGFPGETDADFEATCRVCRQVGFSKVHIFPFSARQGTAAATMPNQVEPHVKAERGRVLAELEAALRRAYFERLCGRSLQVLIESPLEGRPGWVGGTSCRYAPLELEGGLELVGELVRAKVVEQRDGSLRGVSQQTVAAGARPDMAGMPLSA